MANAGTHLQPGVADLEGLCQGVRDLLAQGADIVGCDDFGEYHELVTTDAGYRIGLAQTAQQAPADLDQQQVAGGVAVAVIDQLEVIQVDEQQGEAALLTMGLGDGLVDAVLQQEAIGQTGQAIMKRLAAQRLDTGPGLCQLPVQFAAA
jgi:hypothetical protein